MPLTGDDMADLMYTSGTTGRPKGVVVRHRNVAMVPNGLPRWSGSGWLHASPMFTFAGIASTYNPMKLGLRLLYLPRFDGALYALDANKGTVRWELYLGDEKIAGKPRAPSSGNNCDWDVPSGHPLYSPVAVAEDGTVLVGSGEGLIYAIGEG